MKECHILLSRDGPHENVLKFKPPMCFSLDNVNTLIEKLDTILAELPHRTFDNTSAAVSADKKKKTNGTNGSNGSNGNHSEPPAKKTRSSRIESKSVKVAG